MMRMNMMMVDGDIKHFLGDEDNFTITNRAKTKEPKPSQKKTRGSPTKKKT